MRLSYFIFSFIAVPRIVGVESTPDPRIRERFFIQCMFTGIPVPHTIVWRKGNRKINTTDNHYQVVVIQARNNITSSRLEVFPDSSEFSGVYECVISNDAGSDNTSIHIDLKGKLHVQFGK